MSSNIKCFSTKGRFHQEGMYFLTSFTGQLRGFLSFSEWTNHPPVGRWIFNHYSWGICPFTSKESGNGTPQGYTFFCKPYGPLQGTQETGQYCPFYAVSRLVIAPRSNYFGPYGQPLPQKRTEITQPQQRNFGPAADPTTLSYSGLIPSQCFPCLPEIIRFPRNNTWRHQES